MLGVKEKDFLAPFSLANIQTYLLIAARAKAFGVSDIESVFEKILTQAVEETTINREPVSRQTKQATPCPLCGAPVRVMPVNITKCTRVGGGYTKMKYCSNEQCPYTEMI